MARRPSRPLGSIVSRAGKAAEEALMCLGIPGRILEMRDDRGLAMGQIDFGGVRREVCLAYVQDQVRPGDYVVVHVGFAISRVDEAEARRTFEALREMSQLEELEWMREVAEQSLAAREENGG
jgi:hydrogenase expression/formation protein HypC